MIYSFEFEECVLAAYNSEPVECTLHGRLELKELAPDAVRVYTTKIYIYPTLLSVFLPYQFRLAKIELSVSKMDFI